jgi:hypothetical protein
VKATPWPTTEPLPSVLRDRDLMRVLDVSTDTFYRLKAEGKFDGWMCLPQLTRSTEYSGELVDRWRKGGESRFWSQRRAS